MFFTLGLFVLKKQTLSLFPDLFHFLNLIIGPQYIHRRILPPFLPSLTLLFEPIFPKLCQIVNFLGSCIPNTLLI